MFPMVLRRVVLVALLLSSSTWLHAKDFWEQPFNKWKREELLRILSDSPWAQSETFNQVKGGINSGASGEKELYYRFTVRFFSALPVREAYVRMAQLMNKYDDLDAGQRQEFDVRFKRALNLDLADRIIVAVDYTTNDPDASRDLRAAFETARTDTLKQQVYLISQRLGRVDLKEYFPPSTDGTGAKFIFPRQVNGQPVVGPDDKEVRFDFTVPVINQRVFLTFKVVKMMYRDAQSY
jgi:hypothetical protein